MSSSEITQIEADAPTHYVDMNTRSGSYVHTNAIPSGDFTLVLFYKRSFPAAAKTLWSFGTTQRTNSWQYCYIGVDEPPSAWNGIATRQADTSGEQYVLKSSGYLSSNTWYRCSIAYTASSSSVVFKMDGSTITNSAGSGTLSGSWEALGGATAHSDQSSSEGEIGNVVCFDFLATQTQIDAVAAPS